MEKTCGDRIKETRLEKEFSQEELGEAAGVSRAAVSQWELGDTKSLKNENLFKIAKKLGVVAEWLATGKLPKYPSKVKQSSASYNVRDAHPDFRKIPVINYVQAGNPKSIIDDYAAGDGLEEISTDLELGEYAFALIIKGNSMEPDFKEGDKVLIDPSIQPKPGDFIVAKCNKDEATFKKYRPRGSDKNGNAIYELVPLNEDYAIISSSTTKCKIIGTMIEHRRYRKR